MTPSKTVTRDERSYKHQSIQMEKGKIDPESSGEDFELEEESVLSAGEEAMEAGAQFT